MYLATVNHKDPIELDGLDEAIQFMRTVIRDLHDQGQLPHWRAEALDVQVCNMPRAGFSFTTTEGELFKVALR